MYGCLLINKIAGLTTRLAYPSKFADFVGRMSQLTRITRRILL